MKLHWDCEIPTDGNDLENDWGMGHGIVPVYTSNFQLVRCKSFYNMQHLTISLGTLTSLPLDCQII